jgi:hypothetical protein
MSTLTRRQWLGSLAATALDAPSAFAAREKLRIGITDWNLLLGADPKSLPLAAQLGFEGVQVSCGRKLVDGKLPLDNPELIASYLQLSKENGIPIDGACVDRLHDNGLKSDEARAEVGLGCHSDHQGTAHEGSAAAVFRQMGADEQGRDGLHGRCVTRSSLPKRKKPA